MLYVELFNTAVKVLDVTQRSGSGSRVSGRTRTGLLPLWAVIATEVVAIAAYVVLRQLGQTFLISIIVAAVIGVIGAGLAIATPGRVSLWGQLGRRITFWRRSRRSAPTHPAPFDIPTSDGLPVGLRWDNNRIVSVVRIARPVEPLSLAPNRTITSGSRLRLGTVARALDQFDIELESIDVVAHGWRTRGAGHVTAPYQTLTDALSVVANQDVWAVLRLNPLLCPDAIASRGGGPTGVIRTATAATRRVANHLAREGYITTILSADGITNMGSVLLDGAPSDAADESWNNVSFNALHTVSYSCSSALTPALQTNIWARPTVSTTVATSLSRGESGDFSVSSVIRFSSLRESPVGKPAQLHELTGRQLPSVDFTMPSGRGDIPGLASATMGIDELDSVIVTDGGSGQLIGATDSGDAVSVRLFGPDVRRVDVHTQMATMLQIASRAIAVGARIVVRTDRPDEWRTLYESVRDPMTLHITRSASDRRYAPHNYTLCVLDSRAATEDPTIATQLRVHREPGTVERLDDSCDIAIYQDRQYATRVHVVTHSGALPVTLVSVPAENKLYIRSQSIHPPQRQVSVAESPTQQGHATYVHEPPQAATPPTRGTHAQRHWTPSRHTGGDDAFRPGRTDAIGDVNNGSTADHGRAHHRRRDQ